jgi:hypothetical protein
LSRASVKEASQVKQVAKLFLSHVLQLDYGKHGVQVESWLILIVDPIGQGQSPIVRVTELSHVKQVPMLFGSHLRQFLVHYMQRDLLLIS